MAPWYRYGATLRFGLFVALETRPNVNEALVNSRFRAVCFAAFPM